MFFKKKIHMFFSEAFKECFITQYAEAGYYQKKSD